MLLVGLTTCPFCLLVLSHGAQVFKGITEIVSPVTDEDKIKQCFKASTKIMNEPSAHINERHNPLQSQRDAAAPCATHGHTTVADVGLLLDIPYDDH